MKLKRGSIALIAGLILAFFYAGCQMDVAEVESRVVLVEPYITKHPASQTFAAGASAAVTLTVEVNEWRSGDGSLSYQWYTFDTITDYLNGQITQINGARSAQYTPTGLRTAAGDKNYFYVVVTNTNNGVTSGESSGSIRSDAAIISFGGSGASIPIITRQPGNSVQARFGRSLNPLSIRAEAPPPGELSYRWYRVIVNADGSVTAGAGGVPVSEPIIAGTEDGQTLYETGIECQPNPGDLRIGANYFYVEVTNTSGGQTAREISVPSIVNILPGLRAEVPAISVQPRAAVYFAGEAVVPLTVTGRSQDFGDITYQWYINPTVNSNKGGTAIGGATGSTYSPDLAATQNAFYYVVLTNTNNFVEGEKTAAAASRAVNVRLASVPNIPDPNSTIQIGSLTDPANRFNYVRGYGGMEVAWANFPETYPEDTELMYDPDRLGYNMLRIMLPVSNVNIDLAMEDLVVTTRRRPHYYDNVKIVNKYGGYVAAAPWSPPKEWKSNNSINGGGILRYEYYKQYAAYLKSYAQHMYNRGAPIYCISIQNEPNYTAGYDGCEWTPDEMRNFFKQAGVFTEGVKGWGGGRQIPRVLTMNGESANNVNINHAAIDDPQSYAAIDVFSRHVYGERRTNLWSTRPFVQKQDGKEVWMMEHNINSANAAGYVLDSQWNYIWRFMNDVDLVMRLNNENAFVWWASKRFYSMVGDGQYGTPAGVALPRGWGLSHYSKYTVDATRIGFTMTGSTVGGAAINYTVDADNNPVVNGAAGDMDNVTARITAYVSADGSEISMVMWTPTATTGSGGHDLGTVRIDMPAGFTIGSATAIRSYSRGNNENVFQEPYYVQVSADRSAAYVTLNRSQLMSIKFTAQ